MKVSKIKYIILICVLLLAAGLAEWIVTSHYSEFLTGSVRIGSFLEIYPVYNDDGSWFHGKIGLDYAPVLLFLEDVLAIMMEWFLFRYMDSLRAFFSQSRKFLMLIVCAVPATIYRLFTIIRGAYTLDYLYFKGHGVYDLPDLYLFLTMAGILLFILTLLRVYYPYKKEKVKGMSLFQKWGWEFRFAGVFLKAVFLPRDQWKAHFEKWR